MVLLSLQTVLAIFQVSHRPMGHSPHEGHAFPGDGDDDLGGMCASGDALSIPFA